MAAVLAHAPLQGCRLQKVTSTLGPGHSRPPKAAGGWEAARYRRCVPTLQLRLQELHTVQLLQPQSTARGQWY